MGSRAVVGRTALRLDAATALAEHGCVGSIPALKIEITAGAASAHASKAVAVRGECASVGRAWVCRAVVIDAHASIAETPVAALVVDDTGFAGSAAHVADPSVGIAVCLGITLRAARITTARGHTAIVGAHGSSGAVSICSTLYTSTRSDLADRANGTVTIVVTKRAIVTATFDALITELTVVLGETLHARIAGEVTEEPKGTVGSRFTGLGCVIR